MNRIEKLLKDKCPNGVEYKKLGKYLEILEKKTITKNELSQNGNIPVFNSSRDYFGFTNKYNNDAKAIIVTSHGAYAGFINYFEGKFWAGSLCFPYKVKEENILNSKFVYYYLKNKESHNMKTMVLEGSIPYINKTSIDNLLIPIPPIEIQEEIVVILDKFSKLEAELEAELELRVKQYEFWREYLLFRNKTERFKLKKFAKYSTDRINNETFEEPDFVSVENLLQDKKGVLEYKRSLSPGNYTLFEKENILIGNIRPYLRKIWFSDKTAGTNGDVLVIQNNKPKVILNKYLYYILSSEKFFQYNIQHSKGAKMPRGDKKKIMEFKFPLDYTLKEQQNIVDILDKFDNLINHIKEGIPAEIKSRKKQYEYYRNKLLTFEELKTN